MQETSCDNCGAKLYRSPSKIEPRNYCSRKCYSVVRNMEICQRGIKTRYGMGHKMSREDINKASLKRGDDKHHMWKGDNVGYRGLHYWIQRKLGKPTKCTQCGKNKTTPKSIQWANVDGEYRRNVDDYIALCASCHKIKDLQKYE